MKIEIDHEADGRFIAEVPELPGVLVYEATEAEARNNVIVLALRVIADRLEAGEAVPFEHIVCRRRIGGRRHRPACLSCLIADRLESKTAARQLAPHADAAGLAGLCISHFMTRAKSARGC
jgi:predicted RNase H-like HicB family nuclease